MSEFFDATQLAIIAGVLAPPFISILQQPRWSARVRSVVTIVVAVVVGVVIAASQGAFDTPQLTLATVATVLVAAQATYSGLWKKLGVTSAIEGATSPSSSQGDRRAA